MPFYYAEVFVTINEDPCTIFDRQELLAINLNDDRQGMISPVMLRILSVIVLTKSRPTADIDSKLISLPDFLYFLEDLACKRNEYVRVTAIFINHRWCSLAMKSFSYAELFDIIDFSIFRNVSVQKYSKFCFDTCCPLEIIYISLQKIDSHLNHLRCKTGQKLTTEKVWRPSSLITARLFEPNQCRPRVLTVTQVPHSKVLLVSFLSLSPAFH